VRKGEGDDWGETEEEENRLVEKNSTASQSRDSPNLTEKGARGWGHT